MADSDTGGAEGVGAPAVRPPTDITRGRRPSTTREHIARQALDLFDRRGFDATTVDEIASAVGISRRTFFRYYDSKRDVVWGEFDAEMVRLRDQLMGAPRDEPMMDVLRRAVVASNPRRSKRSRAFRAMCSRVVLGRRPRATSADGRAAGAPTPSVPSVSTSAIGFHFGIECYKVNTSLTCRPEPAEFGRFP